MDEFTRKLRQIDHDALLTFLRALDKPCYESTLHRIAFPESRLLYEDTKTLFHHHFLLFHVLYRLQAALAPIDQYLHVHFMRIYLTDYPETGHCRYYEEKTGQFCRAACSRQKGYCPFHARWVGETELETLSSRYFYLDPENYQHIDISSADAFTNGAWKMVTHYKSLEKSYAILDLPVTADRLMVKRKFRQLAKVYHPDKGSSSYERFNEINRAYRLLMDIVPH